MKENKLNDLLAFYKDNFKEIESREIYKWEAVEHFQKHWDIHEDDFASMLKNAFLKKVP